MRLATIAALTLLVALPPMPCNSVTRLLRWPRHATTMRAAPTVNAAVPLTPDVVNALGSKGAAAPASQPPRAFDANGNRAAGIVLSRKTGARARVGVAYAARFQAYIDDLETNHGARILFMGGIRPGRCSPSSELCASSVEAWSTGVAISPLALPSARSLLLTVSSKADAGAIRTTATPRSM